MTKVCLMLLAMVFLFRASSLLQPSLPIVRKNFSHSLPARMIMRDKGQHFGPCASSPYRRVGYETKTPRLALHLSTSTGEFSPLTIRLSIPTAEDLEEVGALLAVMSHPPDSLFLDGDLGAGKTTLARGFVLGKLGLDNHDAEQAIRVTSPTYLLSNTYCYYDDDRDEELEIHHIDLYRLPGTSSEEFEPLQLGQIFQKCISLVEWPSRLDNTSELLPPSSHRLDVNIVIVPKTDTRLITLTAPVGSTWKQRLKILVEGGMVDDLIDDEED